MRWPKIATTWRLRHGLKSLLAPFFFLGGIGLTIGSLIAIFITSATIAITIIKDLTGKKWLPWIPMLPLIPMFKALGLEIVILVIAGVMFRFGMEWVWLP
jgi:hypothetical protein